MRIAYLINQYPKVSHTFIRREIRALERTGLEVERIALRGWDGDIVDAEDVEERARTRYVLRDGALPLLSSLFLMIMTRPLRTFKALAIVWRMSRRSERPLPIHLIYLAEACRIKRWLSDKNICHLHVHFGTNAAEVAMLVKALGGPGWSFTIHGPEEFNKAPLLGLPEKVRSCTFVTAISSFGRSQIYRLVDYSDWGKVKIVHCGLDTGFLSAGGTPVPNARRLVCIGRLTAQKGHLVLVEAARQLAAQGVDFELILAGDGERRAEIEALIARHGLASRVKITGWIDGARVRQEILASRALVLPSFAEGLPVVIMEAMSLRRPVISTFVAGIPELVRDGSEGWLVPASDVDALANAIRGCLDTGLEELERMGAAAQARVRARHDIDKEIVQLAALFQHHASTA
jgi:colanic acid/amylovoran biosynthesis glycosyltransferase